jgi:Uma2 family endonuclease
MATATIDELRQVRQKAELVGGRIVLMTPAGGYHGYASSQIVASLREYARSTGAGYALGDNIGFRVALPERQSFSPDAAFFVGPLSEDYLDGAPLFAVEIRSREDYGAAAEARLAAKRSDYFAAGTSVVWDVDLREPACVRAYSTNDPQNPIRYQRNELARAEPALPGWGLSVDDLIPASR